MTIRKRAVTSASNGIKQWQDDLPGDISSVRTTGGTYTITIPDKIAGENWACIATARSASTNSYVYSAFCIVEKTSESTFQVRTYYFASNIVDFAFTLEMIYVPVPPYLAGVQPWIPNTISSWTWPLASDDAGDPDVGPIYTGSGGTNIPAVGTGIVGDSRAMSGSTSPAYSNAAAVDPLKRMDLNPIFVQARVAIGDISTAQSLAGSYSSSTSRDWEFGIDGPTGELRVRMNNTGTEFLSGLFLPGDSSWHDVCVQSDPVNQEIRFGLDGVVTVGVRTGSWASAWRTYVGVMGAYQNRGWSGACTQIRFVAEEVIRPGATSYEVGDYQYLSGPP